MAHRFNGIELDELTVDPTPAVAGTVWFRSDLSRLRWYPPSLIAEDLAPSNGWISDTFEENGTISTATNGGDHWALGNGAELTGGQGFMFGVGAQLRTLTGTANTGSFTVEVFKNGVATGATATFDASSPGAVTLGSPIAFAPDDVLKLRTTAVSGATVGTVTFWAAVNDQLPANVSIGSATDVDLSGVADGDVLSWNAVDGEFQPGAPSGGGSTDVSTVTTIAQGSTLGLQQQLQAADGQVGKTVLAVPYTFYQGSEGPTPNHKAQITSLEAGNVVFVYASGADFLAGNVQEGPIFLARGEVYVIEDVQAGTIITATEGAYGFAQQRNNNDESPMPLLSLALAFTDTFFFAFRNCQTYDPGGGSASQGWIHIVCGPLAAEVTLTSGGTVVQGQQDIALEPWQYLRLFTDGNSEYRIQATNSVMAAHNANMGPAPRFYDTRLILPLTNDGISWPRAGQMSALYPGTAVQNYVNDKTTSGPSANDSYTVNPGSPVDWDGQTGATDTDYEPRGATRARAAGLISAYSGADSSGLEATPMCPVSTFTQRIALPLHIRNAGDGGNNGIALASIFTGTARLYQWNPSTGVADLVTVNDPSGTPTTEILLQRREGSGIVVASSAAQQLHPASALISPAADGGAYRFTGDFLGGFIEIDVPCTCVFNAEQNENGATDHTFRGTSGATVVGIHSDDDEQLTYGITPKTIRAEVRQGVDGLLYKRQIGAGGVDSWVVA